MNEDNFHSIDGVEAGHTRLWCAPCLGPWIGLVLVVHGLTREHYRPSCLKYVIYADDSQLHVACDLGLVCFVVGRI